MKVYVVGNGAVGNYLGNLLRNETTEIVFAPRRRADVVPVAAELAIVAVKSYDTQGAIETLRRALGETPASATILCPQNGVGNEELLAAAFGADAIVSCALTVPVERMRNGAVAAANEGGLGLAPVGAVAHNWLIAAFEQAKIPVKVVNDYKSLKWSKLTLNLVANASCAILNVLPERLVEFDEMFELELRALRETRAVMRKQGLAFIDLPRYPVRALLGVATLPSAVAKPILANRIVAARGSKPPSLLLDLRAAKGQTEVGVLNGAVAAAGRSLGVPTPVNAVLARVLSDIAHMPQLWAKYRERPAALVAEIEAEERRGKTAARGKTGVLR
ncbi:MAG: ketopantoate reductase family protein [Vulcanimicrobiaceae bacterium]